MKISFPLAAEAASYDFVDLIDDLLDADGNSALQQSRVEKELGFKVADGGAFAAVDIGAYYQKTVGGPAACITSKDYASGAIGRSAFTVFLDEPGDVFPHKPTQVTGFKDYRSALNAWRALL